MYPTKLLPKQEYGTIDNSQLTNCALIRKIQYEAFNLLERNKETLHMNKNEEFLDNFVRQIIAPQHFNEIYELSTSLYGVYDEDCIELKVTNPALVDWKVGDNIPSASVIEYTIDEDAKPLYLKYSMMNCASEYEYFDQDSNQKICIPCRMTVEHCPVNVNYWHFQTSVYVDSQHIQREQGKKGKYKNIAKHIWENNVISAICNKDEVVPYNGL